MRTEGSTRAKCQGGRDVRNVYPATPWKAPPSVRANGDAGTPGLTPWSPSGAHRRLAVGSGGMARSQISRGGRRANVPDGGGLQ